MKINPIKYLSFQGKIIDSHVHIGNWQGSKYPEEALDVFIKQPLENGDTIDKMIVSNLSCLDGATMKDEIDGNIETLELAKKNPKIVPLAVCAPKTGSVENIKKLFNDNPNEFAGLKFHPNAHEIMATDDLLNPYLEFAKENQLPCLFHCDIPWIDGKLAPLEKRYSSPDKIYEAAKKIPDTPVIMAHFGGGGELVHKEAREVLLKSIENNDATLYADISWVDIDNPNKPTIINLLKELKNHPKGDFTHRILFGSDAPIAEFRDGKNGLSGKQFYEKTITDLKAAIKANFKDEADEMIDKIFYKNAEELFF